MPNLFRPSCTWVNISIRFYKTRGIKGLTINGALFVFQEFFDIHLKPLIKYKEVWDEISFKELFIILFINAVEINISINKKEEGSVSSNVNQRNSKGEESDVSSNDN